MRPSAAVLLSIGQLGGSVSSFRRRAQATRARQALFVLAMAGCAAAIGMSGCGGADTAPYERVAGLEFRSASGAAVSSVWAPVGQSTLVTVIAWDGAGAVIGDPRVSVHLADASVAELLVLPATAADSGHVRIEVRGTRLGTQTRLIALAANGVADTATVDVPLVGGVYDVSTRLLTFSFETAAPSPPDCPDYTLYCTHHRDFDGATLGGTLTVTRDSVYGNLEGLFCSAWTLAGCSAVQPVAAMDYPFYWADKVVSDKGTFTLWLGSGSRPNVYLNATASGDSLYGSVYWSLYVYRSPPTHIGTFIAHLRH